MVPSILKQMTTSQLYSGNIKIKGFDLNQEEQYLLSYDDAKQIMLVVAGKTRGIEVFSHNSVIQVEWKHDKAWVNSK